MRYTKLLERVKENNLNYYDIPVKTRNKIKSLNGLKGRADKTEDEERRKKLLTTVENKDEEITSEIEAFLREKLEGQPEEDNGNEPQTNPDQDTEEEPEEPKEPEGGESNKTPADKEPEGGQSGGQQPPQQEPPKKPERGKDNDPDDLTENEKVLKDLKSKGHKLVSKEFLEKHGYDTSGLKKKGEKLNKYTLSKGRFDVEFKIIER